MNKLDKKSKLILIGLIGVFLTILIIIVGVNIVKNNRRSEQVSYELSKVDNKIENNDDSNDLEDSIWKVDENIEEQKVEEKEEVVDSQKETNKQDKKNPTTISNNTNNKKAMPYYIKINIQANVVNIYTMDNDGNYTVPYKAMLCSTGRATPAAGNVYTMSDRGVWGYMVGNVWAQYYSRITGAILFHSVPYTKRDKSCLEYWEYDKLGTKASAGCIRLSVLNAKWIFDNCKAGTKVEFYSDSNPGPFGKPAERKISGDESVRGWDPTDPDSRNPWKNYNPAVVEAAVTTPKNETPKVKSNTSNNTEKTKSTSNEIKQNVTEDNNTTVNENKEEINKVEQNNVVQDKEEQKKVEQEVEQNNNEENNLEPSKKEENAVKDDTKIEETKKDNTDSQNKNEIQNKTNTVNNSVDTKV